MRVALALTCILAGTGNAQNLPLSPLPYDYNALEPHIDEMTMRVHHMKHAKTYTDKLNNALEKLRSDPETKHLAKMGIDNLLSHLDMIPATFQSIIMIRPGVLGSKLREVALERLHAIVIGVSLALGSPLTFVMHRAFQLDPWLAAPPP